MLKTVPSKRWVNRPANRQGRLMAFGAVILLASVYVAHAAAWTTYSGKVTNSITSPVTIAISGYNVPSRSFVVYPGVTSQFSFSANASTYDIKAVLGKSSSGHRINQPSVSFKIVWDNPTAKSIKLLKL